MFYSIENGISDICCFRRVMSFWAFTTSTEVFNINDDDDK